MTRWHTPTCVSPDVTFSNDNWPNCGTCGRSCPPLEELLTSSQASNGASALQFPVERPQGRMNLYWPPCVPYKRTHSSSHPGDIGSEMVVPVRKSVSKSSNTLDPLYGKTLDKTEFRVACLLAPIHENVPVHVSLETFSDDSHPEYETVSYIWGGENGDNSLRRPIFIGSYWDVLLQTENCWSMLRSIRPNRGERLVWVDALCINQQNLEERTSQVAKMRRIYEQCSRVIAYLGNDLVTQSKPFPQYRPLYELHKASKDNELFPDGHPHHAIFLGLHQLLRRKYFTRIWIIQELLLPERIVFRIGDTEFRADSTIISRITNYHLKSPTWWSTTAAPWVQYIAQKRIPTQHSICDTFEVLRFSRKSHASDPRDRFFGIVALLSNERIQRDLAPDYSISYQHFCIGLFTHWIVNQRAYGLLYKARTLLNPDPCAPSWLPICNSSKAWNDILEPDLSRWPYHCTRDLRPFISADKPSPDRYLQAAKAILKHEPRAISIRALAPVENHRHKTPWHKDSFVNVSTGALALSLVHLFQIKQKPRLIQGHESIGFIYMVNGDDDESSCLYMTTKTRLGKLVLPEFDHVFVVDCAAERTTFDLDYTEHSENRILFLVLRLDTKKSDPYPRHTCRLLAADAFFFQVERANESSDLKGIPCPTTLHSCLLSGSDTENDLDGTKELTYSVADVIDDASYTMDDIMNWSTRTRSNNVDTTQRSWEQIFPNATELESVMLRICRILMFGDVAKRTYDILQAILLKNDGKFDDFNYDNGGPGPVELKFSRTDWDTRIRHYYYRDYLRIDWEVETPDTDWDSDWSWQQALGYVFAEPEASHSSRRLFRSRSKRAPEKPAPGELEVTIRAPATQLVDKMMLTLYWTVEYLERIMHSYDPPLYIETAWEMIKRGPTEEEKLTGVPKIFGGVKIDGSICQVAIS